MNAETVPAAPARAPSPRFDAKFIEEHKLIERYLENKLPAKGARDLESWCRANPEYLNNLKLPERTQASLKLLEASGQPQDLARTEEPWWKTPYVLIGTGRCRVGEPVGLLGVVRQVHPVARRTGGHPGAAVTRAPWFSRRPDRLNASRPTGRRASTRRASS